MDVRRAADWNRKVCSFLMATYLSRTQVPMRGREQVTGPPQTYLGRGRDMRTWAAFILAPLLVPVIAVVWLPNIWTLWVAIVVGYGGILTLGLPLFFALRTVGWTSGWIAAPLGALCGMVMWMITAPLLAFLLDEGLSGAYAAIIDPQWRSGLWPSAAIGATVGTAFWLIARPDRAQISN